VKILIFVILSLLIISSFVFYKGQNGEAQMNDDAKPTEEKIQMYTDAKSMKGEMLKKVPIGSSIQDVKPFMEANGFSCTMYNIRQGLIVRG
jgi:hypothetical protein